MSKRRLTKEDIESLLKTGNVRKCSDKAVTYKKEFKAWAVKKYEEGIEPQGIFKLAGFDLNTIGRDVPSDLLRDWNKVSREKGKEGLAESRGCNSLGRPKTKGMDDKEKIRYLEAKVAYLKAENDFLAQLRKKKGLALSRRTSSK